MANKKRSAGVSPAKESRVGEITIRNRGYLAENQKSNLISSEEAGGTPALRSHRPLPHWETAGGTYFVTFRLSDTIPEILRDELAVRKSLPNDQRPSVRELEALLDRCHGACYLRRAEIAEMVGQSIRHLDGKQYRLLAWVVMPNHVHMVFEVLPQCSLSRIVHSLKSFTAKRANELIGKTGAFWQREYYDRLIRNGKELDRAILYVRSNPEKAGLADWKWVG